MTRIRVGAVALLLLVGVSVGALAIGVGISHSTASPDESAVSGELEGTSIALTDEQQKDYIDEYDDMLTIFDIDSDPNMMLLQSGKDDYVVFTDGPVKTGTATVSGEIFESDDGGGVVFAQSASFDTEGTPVPLNELLENPSEYDREHVQVSGEFEQIPYAVDAGIRDPQAFGALHEDESDERNTVVGSQARFSTVELSGDEVGGSRSVELYTALGGSSLYTLGRTEGEFWVDGDATVHGVVDAPGDSQPVLWTGDVSVNSDDTVTVDEFGDVADDYAGEVITIEGDSVGTATSSKDYLVSVAPCGDDAVVVGVTPPGCLPVVTDSVMHTGALFDGVPESESDVILYAGLSNTDQITPTTAEEGRYEVTGRVVNTHAIDESLPEGYGMIVYDRERIGSLESGTGAMAEAEAFGDAITDGLQRQLESEAHDEYLGGALTSDEPIDEVGSAETVVEDVGFVDQNVTVDEPVQVTVTVTNRGEKRGDKELVLAANGSELQRATVSVAPGETITEELSYTRDSTGSVRLQVNGQEVGMAHVTDEQTDDDDETDEGDDDSTDESASPSDDDGAQTDREETETSPAPDSDDDLPGFGVVVGLVGLLLGVYFARRASLGPSHFGY